MSGYQYSITILELESIYNNSNALSVRSPVLGEERLRFVLCVPFSALTVFTLMVGLQERHLSHCKTLFQ